MQKSIRLGFGIAVLFAAGVVAVSVFGRHDSWFLRAGQGNAVRCLVQSPCVQVIDHDTAKLAETVPLAASSPCGQGKNWHKVSGAPEIRLLLICRDGAKSYLYHMGRLKGREAGAEQWMRCAETGCKAEISLLSGAAP